MNIPEEDDEISDLLIETYGPKKSRYLILYKWYLNNIKIYVIKYQI